MRVLFATAPGSGFFLPTIPLAWALRAAGHDVLVAGTGTASRTIAASGLSTVDVCPGEDVFGEFIRTGNAIGRIRPDGTAEPGEGLAIFGRMMADGLLALASDYAPDLVVSTLEQGAGPIVAAVLEVPYVEQSVRLAWPSRSAPAVHYRDAVQHRLASTRARLGATGPAAVPDAFIDVAPPSVADAPGGDRWLMRYVPYNEGRVLPDWVYSRPARPRVCVTMGTVVGGGASSPLREMFLDMVYELVSELSDLDVEIVLAMGENADAGPALPANMRQGGWVPLDALLPSCSAIIHHGGAGTSFAALANGLPQLVLPRAADQPANAEVLVERGCALALQQAELSATAIRDGLLRLLHDPALLKVAVEVRDELRAMPAPSTVVGRLEGLLR